MFARFHRTVFVLGSLALMIPSVSACHEPATSPSPQASASASHGSSRAGEFTLDVIAERTCPAEPYSSLSNDEVLLGVNVKLRALTDQVPQNYYYGRIVDADGKRHDAGFAGCEPRLSGPPLLAGQTATGYINFRLPREAAGLTLEYSPRVGNRTQAAAPRVTKTLAR